MFGLRLTPYHLSWLFLGPLLAAALLWSEGAWRWVEILALLGLAGTAIGLGVSFPQLQFFGRSLCRVSTNEKAAALTFDDGPDPRTTPALLDLLAKRGPASRSGSADRCRRASD